MNGIPYQRIGVGLIVLVATVPFLGKAFHVDDPLYLAVSRQILKNPWDPYGAEIVWEKAEESLFDADFNPPLWSYLLAGVLKFTGEPSVTVESSGVDERGTPLFVAVASSRVPEVAMHVVESIFVAAAIVALYLLSTRWVCWPLTSTTLIALSPAMLPGQNVMLEAPVMAFWLWSTWCYLRGVESDNMRWTSASGALAACAVMTKYTSGLLLLILIADIVRRRKLRSLCIVVLPVSALVLWSLHNWFVYERLHLLVIVSRAQTGGRAPLGIRLDESWGRLFAVLRAVGAITALGLPVAAIVTRRFGLWALILLLCVGVGVGFVGKSDMANRLVDRDGRDPGRIFPETIPSHLVVFGALGAISVLGLVMCCRNKDERANGIGDLQTSAASDERLLWVWWLAVFSFGVFATPFLAIRHLLPGLPPLVWLVLRRLDAAYAGIRPRIATYVLTLTVAISTVSGFCVAKADYDWANWYRHLAIDVASRTVVAGRTRDKTVWYTGHWGWAYYADRVGMQPYVPGRTQMGEGDFLLMPLVQTWQLPSQELNRYLHGLMRPIQPKPKQIQWTGRPEIDRALDWCLNSVRSVSNEVHLYGDGTVTIPWQFSRKPLEYFGVIEVRQVPKENDSSEQPPARDRTNGGRSSGSDKPE